MNFRPKCIKLDNSFVRTNTPPSVSPACQMPQEHSQSRTRGTHTDAHRKQRKGVRPAPCPGDLHTSNNEKATSGQGHSTQHLKGVHLQVLLEYS